MVLKVDSCVIICKFRKTAILGKLKVFLADRFEFANDGSYIPLFSGCAVDNAYVGYSCFYCREGSGTHFNELGAISSRLLFMGWKQHMLLSYRSYE